MISKRYDDFHDEDAYVVRGEEQDEPLTFAFDDEMLDYRGKNNTYAWRAAKLSATSSWVDVSANVGYNKADVWSEMEEQIFAESAGIYAPLAEQFAVKSASIVRAVETLSKAIPDQTVVDRMDKIEKMLENMALQLERRVNFHPAPPLSGAILKPQPSRLTPTTSILRLKNSVQPEPTDKSGGAVTAPPQQENKSSGKKPASSKRRQRPVKSKGASTLKTSVAPPTAL